VFLFPARLPGDAGFGHVAAALDRPDIWALDMMGLLAQHDSLLGITLAVGILVDDAIVEIENTSAHQDGQVALSAALEAAD